MDPGQALRSVGGGTGGDRRPLDGMSAVQRAFHFLQGSVEVLSAATGWLSGLLGGTKVDGANNEGARKRSMPARAVTASNGNGSGNGSGSNVGAVAAAQRADVNVGAHKRSKPTCAATTRTAANGRGGNPLAGISTVQLAFHFLQGPADVLSAATACRRWRELARADSVWRVKFKREGMVRKARLFDVALPAVGGSVGFSSSSAASEHGEAIRADLALYAQVFALKVSYGTTQLARKRALAAPASPPLAPVAITTTFPAIQDEGRGEAPP